jgi:hypothetical protein
LSELSYVGRRVLAHLPVWVKDEKAHIKAEGGPELSVRSYSLVELTERLLADQSTVDMDEATVEGILKELAKAGLCEDRDGWRMTELGFEVLTDPTPPEEQTPGPAFIHLNPGVAVTSARGD